MLAVLFGLLLIAALEGVLRLVGVPAYSQVVSMRIWAGRPLTEHIFTPKRDAFGQLAYWTSHEESGLGISCQCFPARKDAATVRIFCFGGSTTYGSPFDGETEQIRLFAELFRAELKMDKGDMQGAFSGLSSLVRSHPNCALFHYWLGKCCDQSCEFTSAKAHYNRAVDIEWWGLRMTESLRDTMEAVARKNSVPYVDLFEVFESHSPEGIVGLNLMVDYCHPTVSGHKLVAKSVLRAAISSGVLPAVFSEEAFERATARPVDERVDHPSRRPADRFDQIVQQLAKRQIVGSLPGLVDHESAEIAARMGDYFLVEGEPENATAWFKRALEFDPNAASVARKLSQLGI